jgi:hypothetical protein
MWLRSRTTPWRLVMLQVSFADFSMMPLLQLACDAKPACSIPTEKLFVDTPCRLHWLPPA